MYMFDEIVATVERNKEAYITPHIIIIMCN
jgi:hypothetical protein